MATNYRHIFDSRYNKHIIIILLLAAGGYGAHHFIRETLEVPQVPKDKLTESPESPRKISPHSGSPVILPKDRSLKSYSGDDLLALFNEFNTGANENANKERDVRSAEYIVDSGDTVVTDGYETAPGVYVFSTITFRVSGSSSEPKIAFNLNRARLSLSGEYTDLVNDESESESGIGGYSAYNGKFKLNLKGMVLPNGRQIMVRVRESKYANRKTRVIFPDGTILEE